MIYPSPSHSNPPLLQDRPNDLRATFALVRESLRTGRGHNSTIRFARSAEELFESIRLCTQIVALVGLVVK